MSVEKGLYQLVTQDVTVQAAVGVDANGVAKAHWILAPQGTVLPFMVFSRIGTTDTYTMAGPIGLREGLFQVVCYSTSYYGSRNVADTVRKFLQNYTGTLPDGTVVKSVIVDKDFDHQYEDGGKGFVFGAYLQFRIWYLD